jgi:glutathione S-transferase
MTVQVLGRPASINVRKVLWTCDELGLAYDNVPWGSGELKLDAPDFRALNPDGLVPVLVDGDLVLTQSNAICRYLAAKHGRVDVLPLSPAARATVEQWMDWQATELNAAWRYAFMGLVRGDPQYQDGATIRKSADAWNAKMTLLEAQLGKTGAYVAGAGFTLADVILGLSTHRWLSTPIKRPALPALTAWMERLATRPAFALHCRAGVP